MMPAQSIELPAGAPHPVNHAAVQEWKRHWPVVLVAMIGVSLSGVQFYSQGLFMAPLQAAFGWSRAEVTAGPSLLSLMTAVTIAVSGVLVDRLGPRRVALAGLFLFCLSFAAVALIQGPLWQWLAIWAVIAFTFPLVGPTIWSSAVVSWFTASRGLALALTLTGLGFSSFLTPILTQYLIETLGWRGAYVALPLLWFVVLLPLTYFLFFGGRDTLPAGRTARTDVPVLAGLSVAQGFRSSHFIRISLALLLFGSGLLALIVHFVAIVTEGGLDRPSAAVAAGVVGLTSIFSRVLVGLLLDRYHGRYIGFVMFGAPMIAVAILLNYDGSYAMALAAAAILGLSLGAEVDTVGYLITRYVGTRSFGTFFGVLMGLANAAAGAGSFAAGVIYDTTGGYSMLMWALLPAFLISAVIMGSLGPYLDFTPAREGADGEEERK